MANNETECSPSEVCLSDSNSELLIPTPWSDESKNEKRKGNEGMDDHVPDEIDGAKGEQVANHGGDELVDKGKPLKRKRVYAE
ncbi:hypothetical protein Tco_0489785 [Tanacetum coccineum]